MNTQNRVSKYLLYAIGEIVLVVFGILIALQVNNWNESNKRARAETEFLKGVQNDLSVDMNYINMVLHKLRKKTNAFDEMDLDLPKPNMDSLISIYLFEGNYTFYPISGSFQSALAGNELNTYRNKKVISSLIKLYNSTYPRLIHNANLLDERWTNLSETYIRERRLKNLESLSKDDYPKVMDDIYFHYIQAIWYTKILEEAISEISYLQTQLKG